MVIREDDQAKEAKKNTEYMLVTKRDVFGSEYKCCSASTLQNKSPQCHFVKTLLNSACILMLLNDADCCALCF
jgi:hypothetical protein